MKKIIFLLVATAVLISGASVLAQDSNLPSVSLTPDSPFYIFKTLKENIQIFFTFNAEQKARQYLHLADVRLAEYQKMLEKGKTDLAQKTLDKYQKQLNRAISKVEELKSKGKDVKDIFESIASTTAKHIEVLEDNLQKVPEATKQGIERAIENAKKISGNPYIKVIYPNGGEILAIGNTYTIKWQSSGLDKIYIDVWGAIILAIGAYMIINYEKEKKIEQVKPRRMAT